MKLRPYQSEALDAICQGLWLDGVQRGLVVLCTAAGKTVVFAELPPSVNGQTLVIAHRKELIRQAAKKIAQAHPGLRVETERAEERASAEADVIVASIQTLAQPKRRAKVLTGEIGLVIVDEAHHILEDNTYGTVLRDLGCFEPGGTRLLGVTATPYRHGDAPLTAFERVLYEKPILEMIDEGWIAPPRAKAIYTKTSLDAVSTRKGDFAEGELSEAVNTATRNIEIVRAYEKECVGRRSTLVFCVDKAHARDLLAAFLAAKVTAEVVFGDTGDNERDRVFERFASGETQVLLNVGVATEGTDMPHVDAVILARPTKSRGLVTQMVGRGFRLSPETGKADCLILDMVDNASRHLLVTSAAVLDLPPKANAKGGELRKLKKKVDEFAAEFPGVDLSHAEITEEWLDQRRRDIKALMERSRTEVASRDVDLFGARVDPEARKATKLAWFRNFDGALRLNLPADEEGRRAWASVKADAAGTYWLEMPERNHGPYPTEAEALKVAEWEVSSSYGDQLGLIRSKATWHSKPASEKQTALIKKLGGAVPEKMTAGQAKETIDALLSQREATWDGPCTPAQAWALRRQGYDVRDLTKREAGRLLASLKRA